MVESEMSSMIDEVNYEMKILYPGQYHPSRKRRQTKEETCDEREE